MSAVVLENIYKSYGETKALAGASLHCDFGEIHAIVGENGSGKSTLAKVISGVVPADSGSIDVLGIAPQTPAEGIHAGVSTIYQEIMVAEDLTIWENMFAGADGLWRRTSTVAERKQRARETLKRLAGVDIDPDMPVASLPLSVKQWIVIARAILQKPKLLIFDESSAALDLEATNRLHEEMQALKATGSSIILVTHRIAELVKICDSATVLRDGVTVGRLSREDINEENLLRLMSADVRHSAAAVRQRKVISTEQKPVIEACAVTIPVGAKPVDFKIHPGEIVGIAGLDGAGQSDFVRILAGIQTADDGLVRVWDAATEDRIINNLADADSAGITYVSGDRKKEGIFPNLSILENFGLALYGRHSSEKMGLIDKKAVSAAFSGEQDRLSIKLGRLADRITTLSGGNQQKVLIARAFASAPRVIILNDPARGVDIGTKQDLYTHLREFASNGGAVVYLSTEIEEFLNFADRADVFFEGTLFNSFTGSDISEDNLLAAMFGQTGTVDFDPSDAEEVA